MESERPAVSAAPDLGPLYGLAAKSQSWPTAEVTE